MRRGENLFAVLLESSGEMNTPELSLPVVVTRHSLDHCTTTPRRPAERLHNNCTWNSLINLPDILVSHQVHRETSGQGVRNACGLIPLIVFTEKFRTIILVSQATKKHPS